LLFDAIQGAYYVYTSSGVQLVNLSAAQTVYPLFTDFLAGKLIEDFDESTRLLTTQKLSSPMLKAVTVVTDRYLVLSYGATSLTHAIVYDLQYRRVGKLKIPHTACFDFKYSVPEVADSPRDSFGFLQLDGTIKLVNFDVGSSDRVGVLLLGKYQYARSRLLMLDEIGLENIKQTDSFNLYNLVSLDGKNTAETIPYLADNHTNYRRYTARSTGKNHSLLAIRAFNLVSIELTFHITGNR
jgi:hypothetical protein